MIQDYFHFTRNDRAGMLVILTVMVGVILLPGWLETGSSGQVAGSRPVPTRKTYTANQASGNGQQVTGNRKQEAGSRYSVYQNAYPESKTVKAELFYFDPNQLDASGWAKLGLRDKTIRIILNYLSKGGHFKKAEDLQRIYGLHPDEYTRLAPFVQISETGKPSVMATPPPLPKNDNARKEKTFQPIDINLSDTTAWINLPGIGSKLATRIILFREKLGGFYAVEQVGETFGLADSVFQRIKKHLQLLSTAVRKININTATIDQLKAHPYIRYELAKPIIAYRDQHGLFKQLNELKMIPGINDSKFEQLVHYLKLSDQE